MKKSFYIGTVLTSILLVAVLVYAYGGTNPAVHGHDSGESNLAPLYINGNNVGIGTTSPNHRLTVYGTTSDSSANALVVVNAGGSEVIVGRNDGNVGIGTASPSEKLEVDGNIEVTGKVYMGYQRVQGTACSSDQCVSRANCPNGKKVIGGGCRPSNCAENGYEYSYPEDDDTWYCSSNRCSNNIAYAICAYIDN